MPIPLAVTGAGASGGIDFDPSELTCEIRFESRVVDPDTKQWTGDWTIEGDDWAKIEPLRGRELFMAQQVKSRVSHRVTLNYREGVKPSWRIVFKERNLEIETVINVLEADVVLELMCIEEIDETS